MTTYKTVKGIEVLEYLMAGCKIAHLYNNGYQSDFLSLADVLPYSPYSDIENHQFKIDESTRKKENLTLEEALCAMRHGHCVRWDDGEVLYKMIDSVVMFETHISTWRRPEVLYPASYSIVPDPSIKEKKKIDHSKEYESPAFVKSKTKIPEEHSINWVGKIWEDEMCQQFYFMINSNAAHFFRRFKTREEAEKAREALINKIEAYWKEK